MRFLILLLLLLSACSSAPEIRPYHFYLYSRKQDCAVMLKDPSPANDVCGEKMDHMIMMTISDYKMMEVERATHKARLEDCDD